MLTFWMIEDACGGRMPAEEAIWEFALTGNVPLEIKAGEIIYGAREWGFLLAHNPEMTTRFMLPALGRELRHDREQYRAGKP